MAGDGAPLVLVHGVGADGRSWDEVISALGPGFRILMLDLAGHGRSPPIRERYSLQRFAQDVLETMDRAEMPRAHVVGFSLGGLIAQQIALSAPGRVDRLALLAAVAGRTDEERAKVVGRLDAIRAGGIAAVTGAARERWFTEEFVRTNPDRIAKRIAELEANDLESYLEAYRVFGTSELAPELHRIAVRTLVLTGENDVGSNTRMARFMHDAIQGSELVILPRLKHSLLVEAPHVLAAELRRFLLAP
jgi:(E)-2-((N-methylformamido)methylene)succinate hydrolase